MYHIVYKITNEVNKKVYIGKHSTSNINDGYLGSGVALKNAIKKYGKQNFTKRILKIFDDEESAYEYESRILTEAFIASSNTYNMTNKRSGSYAGGKRSEETKKKMSDAKKGRASRKGHKNSPEHRRKISESLRNAELSRSEEQKKRQSEVIFKICAAKRERIIQDNEDIIRRLHNENMNVSDMMKQTGLSRHFITLTLKHLGLYTPYNKGNRTSKTKGRMRPQVTCPYCNKTGGAPQMKQWHFDNCKLKSHKS